LAKVGEDVFVAAIPGNHDMENFRDGESAVDSLPIAGVLKNSGAILNGIHVHGIPYCHDISEFKEKFDEAALTVEPDIFMIHQGIDNFSGGGMPLTGLTAEWLNSYLAPGQFVVAGHYHCWGRSGAVIQVGAPYQQAFGDENEKGCFVLDLDSGESEFFKLEAPKFVTVESLKDVGVRHLVGDFVRVKAKTLATGEKIAEAARLAGAASVVLDIERVYSKAHSETIKITADPVEMISKYIDIEGERYSPDDKRDILGLFEVIRC
jgi:DNA repair exonuclease SbcCD nuclease subunit